MRKYPTRIRVDNWVRIVATKEVGRVEAKQAGCYRISLPAGLVLKNRREIARARAPRYWNWGNDLE